MTNTDWTTPENLARLGALAEAATWGPWRIGDDWGPACEYDWPVIDGNGDPLCRCPGDGVRGGHFVADAAFVAAARSAVPQLLAEVEQLKRDLRWYQTTNLTARAEAAEAAIERVRALAERVRNRMMATAKPSEILAALDGE